MPAGTPFSTEQLPTGALAGFTFFLDGFAAALVVGHVALLTQNQLLERSGVGGPGPGGRISDHHMKRPLTTNFAASLPSLALQGETEPPLVPTWREVAPIVSALVATLEAIETGPKAGPAMRAHRSAMRRQGSAAAALGGSASDGGGAASGCGGRPCSRRAASRVQS